MCGERTPSLRGKEKAFSAAEVHEDGKFRGYIYVILGSQMCNVTKKEEPRTFIPGSPSYITLRSTFYYNFRASPVCLIKVFPSGSPGTQSGLSLSL